MNAPAEREAAPGQDLSLLYNGTRLIDQTFHNSWMASSGIAERDNRKVVSFGDTQYPIFEDYRFAYYQSLYDHGPVPEGIYEVAAKVDPSHEYASFRNDGSCKLVRSQHIEKIPRGDTRDWATGGPTKTTAGPCEKYWQNWGFNRVALNPLHIAHPNRNGFFLHDSAKGFTHGCIETETRFFSFLVDLVTKSPGIKVTLRVSYTWGAYTRTYGGTNQLLHDERSQDDMLDKAWLSLFNLGLLPPAGATSVVTGPYTFFGYPATDVQ